MRVLLQKVTHGQVTVADTLVGSVGLGYVALVGITHTDTLKEIEHMANKVVHLRVFEDEHGKMNRSLLDVGGEVLVVSQFTLYANARGGRRPDFIQAARPEIAEPLVSAFMQALQQAGVARVASGQFGAMMQVALVNDGPVTIWLDSAELNTPK
jgi:D-aminoacyl-tRNA deacylase